MLVQSFRFLRYLSTVSLLRSCMVAHWFLLQLVVVGDQSSGKSSVLESLTGFSFPRAAGLCTRYATQITCCRDPVKTVNISIIPRPDADEDLKAKLLAFQRRLVELDNDALAKVFEEVCLEYPFYRFTLTRRLGKRNHGHPHDSC